MCLLLPCPLRKGREPRALLREAPFDPVFADVVVEFERVGRDFDFLDQLLEDDLADGRRVDPFQLNEVLHRGQVSAINLGPSDFLDPIFFEPLIRDGIQSCLLLRP